MIKETEQINTILFLTKTHYDKYSYFDILNADFVIVSSSFLENKCIINNICVNLTTKGNYLTSSDFSFTSLNDNINKEFKKIYNNPLALFTKQVNIYGIHWHRIIVDEFHEIFTINKYKNIKLLLPLFNSTYKWIVTGTPFPQEELLYKIVQFQTNYNINFTNDMLNLKDIQQYLINNFFRRNTKKSVINEHKLLPLKERIIWLKFSETEKLIYNSYLANQNNSLESIFLRKLCCHPKLSEEIKNKLSNCKTLDDIQEAMYTINYNNMKIAENKLKKIQDKKEIYLIFIERYKIKRIKYILKKKLKYNVIIDYFPEIPININVINDNNNDNNNNNDDNNEDNIINDDDIILNENENDSDNENENENDINVKPNYTITKDNIEESILLTNNYWNVNRTTLDNMYLKLNEINKRIEILQNEYNGKKKTYDYYSSVYEKIKKTFEINNNSDTESEIDNETCGICLGEIDAINLGVTKCGHIFCFDCITLIAQLKHNCPYCLKSLTVTDIDKITYKKALVTTDHFKNKKELINKVGTKLGNLIVFLKSTNKHTIIFSQWDDLLKEVGILLNDFGIKNIFCKGNVWQRDKALRLFNSNDDIKVIMLSSNSAASGANLTKASQVILLDPVYGSYEYRKSTEWQSIGRAHRMGQVNQVEVIRLIIKDTVEEDIYKQNQLENSKYIGENTNYSIFEDNNFKEIDEIIEIDEECNNVDIETYNELSNINKEKLTEKNTKINTKNNKKKIKII
jgi:SNF2 family DNA or RNA helicase